MQTTKADMVIAMMILVMFLAQSGLKIKVMHAVLKNKITQPCQLQK